MTNRKIALFASSFLLAAGLIGLIIVCAVYVVTLMTASRHSVVIDAGSTSSKLNLFEWRDEPFRTNGEVTQKNQTKVKPGISSYIAEPFKAYEALESPLHQLLMEVPMTKWKDIPVYLAATAGMRLALLDDPLGSVNLFDVLRRGLLTSGLEVETPNERIRMLSGSEEGLYGWVSVNYILGRITAKKQVLPVETVGSLDLGGASTQIAFVSDTKPGSVAASIDYHPLRLFGQLYEVYSHSFLCYGKNEFEKRTMGSIIVKTQQPKTSPISNPCFPAGYESPSEPITSIFQGPCMSGPYATKVFNKNLDAPSGMTEYSFTGTGNPEQCLQVMKEQFNTSTCTNPPCSFNNVHQPTIRGLFRAYSGFSYVMKYLFPKKSTDFTKSEVQNAVSTFCRKNWGEIAAETPKDQHAFTAKYCFDGLYVLTLLENYGFRTDESWKGITFGSKIKDVSVSWALGYMLDQSGFLPSESPKIKLPTAAFVPLAILFAAMVLIGFIVLMITVCGKQK